MATVVGVGSTGASDLFVQGLDVPISGSSVVGQPIIVAIGRWESGNPVMTPPAGFDSVAEVVLGQQKIQVFVGLCPTGPPASLHFDWVGQQWTTAHSVSLTGTDTAAPIDVFNTAVSASGAAYPPVSVTTSETLLLWFATNENSATRTSPTSYSFVAESNYLASASGGITTASGGTLSGSTLTEVVLLAVASEAAGVPVAGDGVASSSSSATATATSLRAGTGASPASFGAYATPNASRAASGAGSAASSALALTRVARSVAGRMAASSSAKGTEAAGVAVNHVLPLTSHRPSVESSLRCLPPQAERVSTVGT